MSVVPALTYAMRRILGDQYTHAPSTDAEWIALSAVAAAVQACDEVERATAKFPTWPTDPLHALAVLGEEFGELTKAVLQHTYEPHKANLDDVRTEALQTAAMAIRFLMSFDRYAYRHCEQHRQGGPDPLPKVPGGAVASDERGAWTCGACGFRGFWSGGPHCMGEGSA